MIKRLLLVVAMFAISFQALAQTEGYSIQTTSGGDDYTYYCENGNVIHFIIPFYGDFSATHGGQTVDQYLASKNCTYKKF